MPQTPRVFFTNAHLPCVVIGAPAPCFPPGEALGRNGNAKGVLPGYSDDVLPRPMDQPQVELVLRVHQRPGGKCAAD